MNGMKLEGEIEALGEIDGSNGVHEVVIRREDNSCVTLTGLTIDEVRMLAPMFMDVVTVFVGVPA